MFSYWLKNRAWISFLIVIVLALLMCLIFVNVQIKTEAENRTKTSVYTDSEIDYDIPAPTKVQLEQIAQEDFVDSVFGYYYTETNLTFQGKTIKTKILFSDYMQNVGFTMYSDNRCIEKSVAKLDNPIFVDYKYAMDNGIKLEDKLCFQDIVFDVQAIFETNTYYDSAILIPLVGKQKELIEKNGTAYSGAYIKTNDTAKARAYWQNYKPYGRLRSPEEFSTVEAYNYHYSEWNSTNYLTEITYFPDRVQSIKTETYPNKLIWSVLFVVIAFAFDVILSFRKSERGFFKKKEYAKDIIWYYVFTVLFETIIAAIVLFVGAWVIKGATLYYVSKALMQSVFVQTGITIAVFFICNLSWGYASSRIKK